MSRPKHRKPPAMPYWWWLGQDGCWFCKTRNACSNCSVIKKDRKAFFGKKVKGRHSTNHKMNADKLAKIYERLTL